MNKYEWKPELPKLFKGDAQEIGERLESIADKLNGSLVAADVVEDARNKKSPLHPNFEWDDAKAAHEHRLATARTLVGSIRVVMVNEKAVEPPVRAFVHVSREIGYMPIAEAFKIKDIADSVVDDAMREYKLWYNKYNALKEFGKIVEAIEAQGLLLAA